MSDKPSDKQSQRPFRSTREEVGQAESLENPFGAAYHLAFTDQNFMMREELRPLRVQLELMRPELVLQDYNVNETIVFFGSARIPNEALAKKQLAKAKEQLKLSPDDPKLRRFVDKAKHIYRNSQYLKHATQLAETIARDDTSDYVVVTGGGPSFMQAANQGAHNAGERSVALNVSLPNEQMPNPYVTPELTFQFHYFAVRKMHFLMRAKAVVVFPGGLGTLDELFESLTLMQTNKIERIPLLLFNKNFWQHIINFDGLVQEGTISASDLELFTFVETADDAWQAIKAFYA